MLLENFVIRAPTHLCLGLITWIWIAAIGLPIEAQTDTEIQVHVGTKGDQVSILIGGLGSEDLQRLVADDTPADGRAFVYLAADHSRQSPLLGGFKISGNELEFYPRYPLKAGIEYLVRIPDNQGYQEFPVRMPSNPQAIEPPQVVGIFPTSEQLPQNLLRIYVQFSQPMRRGEAYTHIKLLDDQELEIERPFLELPQELWDPEQKRFALLFDPGRIKRDLAPRIELGPPLEVGRKYSLIVEKTWRSAAGQSLVETHIKRFEVIEPWDKKLDASTWKVETPDHDEGSRTGIQIQFDRPLNRAMLDSSIRVTCDGTPVSGSISVVDQETRWCFVPDRPWSPGNYKIAIDNDIEDIAGNTLRKAFEVYLLQEGPRQANSTKITSKATLQATESQTQFSFKINETKKAK